MKKIVKDILNKYKWLLVIQAVFVVINVILFTYPSQILGQIIDLLYNVENNKIQIMKLAIFMLIACVGTLLTRIIWKNLEFLIEIKVRKNLTDRLFTKLLKTKIEKLNDIKNGEIMSYFAGDVKKIAMILVRFSSTTARIVSFFVIVIFRMSSGCNLSLTAAVISPIIITLIIILILRSKLNTDLKIVQESFTDMSEYVQESTDSIRTMKAFVGEEKQINSFIEKNKKLRRNNLKVSKD